MTARQGDQSRVVRNGEKSVCDTSRNIQYIPGRCFQSHGKDFSVCFAVFSEVDNHIQHLAIDARNDQCVLLAVRMEMQALDRILRTKQILRIRKIVNEPFMPEGR